ncbi:MAG: 2Fe-2S iron-sulfur cluster binding domain-containing protein, partial [Burkholderiaceae bacterium]|nr:2Fe-2S iron-sulfur cluster binding domain-containing protein [Burkholderiaceae bacterium]
MSITVTLQPSGRSFTVQRDEPILAAALRAGIGLPYGCKDGACGSCKCRLLDGRVIHGAHQLSALSVAEEESGYALTCCATPQTDVVLEARTVAGVGEMPVRKMPARVTRIDKAAADVAIVTLQLPANEALRYHAGQYIDVLLRDGARRSYSMANAPHTRGDKPWIELHI